MDISRIANPNVFKAIDNFFNLGNRNISGLYNIALNYSNSKRTLNSVFYKNCRTEDNDTNYSGHDIELFLSVLAKLLKSGFMGYEIVEYKEQPYKTDVVIDLGSKFSKLKLYKPSVKPKSINFLA